jgi:hypothetical protein
MAPEEAIQPLRNLLLIRKDQPSDDDGTYGLIIAPNSSRPDPHGRGIVLSGGPQTSLPPGTRVGFGFYAATGVGILADERQSELAILAQEEVLFIESEAGGVAS